MKRNNTIDFLRGMCMLYIVGVVHLSQYLGKQYYLYYNQYGNSITWSCLGTFSLISGYLIGSKYYCRSTDDVLLFFKKRIIRFYPLFIISSFLLFVIGFNDISRTIYALLGLSPFVSNKPLTLWYISMIMIFYSISPAVLITRKNRYLLCVLVFIIFFLLSRFLTIDAKFFYNLFFYLLGLCVSTINLKLRAYNRMGGLLLFLYAFMLVMLNPCSSFLFRRIVDALGVFVLVFLAYYLSRFWSLKNKLVYMMSYVSMSIYLFHRFTYWVCLKVYDPEYISCRFFYLVLIALPVSFVFAYFAQKMYDKMIVSFKINFK